MSWFKEYNQVHYTHTEASVWTMCEPVCTIEPFGVVLCSPQRWHAAQAAVDDRITTREVDDGGGVQLAALCHHRGGVVARVVRTASHAVHPLQHAAYVAHLWHHEREREGETGSLAGYLCHVFTEFLVACLLPLWWCIVAGKHWCHRSWPRSCSPAGLWCSSDIQSAETYRRRRKLSKSYSGAD